MARRSRGVEYDTYLKSLLRGRPVAELTTEQRNQVLDELINMQLLASQGTKDGVEKDPDVAAQLTVVRIARAGGCGIREVLEGQGTDGCGIARRI